MSDWIFAMTSSRFKLEVLERTGLAVPHSEYGGSPIASSNSKTPTFHTSARIAASCEDNGSPLKHSGAVQFTNFVAN